VIRKAAWGVPERKLNGPKLETEDHPQYELSQNSFFSLLSSLTLHKHFFVTDVTHYWVLGLPKLLIQRLCHSPIQYVVMGSISWQTLTHNSVTVFFVLRWKYFYHISCDWELNPQQVALQHSKVSGALPNCAPMVELSLHKLKN